MKYLLLLLNLMLLQSIIGQTYQKKSTSDGSSNSYNKKQYTSSNVDTTNLSRISYIGEYKVIKDSIVNYDFGSDTINVQWRINLNNLRYDSLYNLWYDSNQYELFESDLITLASANLYEQASVNLVKKFNVDIFFQLPEKSKLLGVYKYTALLNSNIIKNTNDMIHESKYIYKDTQAIFTNIISDHIGELTFVKFDSGVYSCRYLTAPMVIVYCINRSRKYYLMCTESISSELSNMIAPGIKSTRVITIRE